jgi:hypothetical protein
MKILDIFKSKSEVEEDELNRVLRAIVSLEEQRTAAKTAVDAAKEALQNRIAESVANGGSTAGQDKLTAKVLEAQARLAAIVQVIHNAEAEAKALITAGAAERKTKIADLQGKIKEVKRSIGRRQAADIAAFVHRHGLNIQWSNKQNRGIIQVPAWFELEPEEIAEIDQAAQCDVHVDPQNSELDALSAELTRQNAMQNLMLDQSLSVLLDEKRRLHK